MSKTRAAAFASGLLVGGFIFFRFGWDTNMALTGWAWYQGAALLAGIGLAGIFPGAWLGAAAGLVIGAIAAEAAVTIAHIARDSTCCNLWPIGLLLVFFFTLPAPLIGSRIGLLCARAHLPVASYIAVLAAALSIGALLPHLQASQRQTLETRTIPTLLHQIYSAELAYKATPAASFTCDGTLLPGPAGKLAWTQIGADRRKKYLIVQQYTIALDCPSDDRHFQVRAFSHDARNPAKSITMDETGKLTIQPTR